MVFSSQAVKRRKEVFQEAGVPGILTDYVVSARISKYRPIRRDDYLFVFTAEEGVALAQVEAIYTKSGGKHAKHGDTPECMSIGAISNLDVQMFEHVHGLQFQVLARADPLLGQRFRFLAANAVLCLVAGVPTVVQPEVVSLTEQEANARPSEPIRTKFCLYEAVPDHPDIQPAPKGPAKNPDTDGDRLEGRSKVRTFPPKPVRT
ncbi:hypothetical protein LXA43DRAFT_1129541 [Ganoderma leucocontextum]|nr:hypothetical protein LXA43DRAFT_1129541 [Ganoderma leucocontextum]